MWCRAINHRDFMSKGAAVIDPNEESIHRIGAPSAAPADLSRRGARGALLYTLRLVRLVIYIYISVVIARLQ